MLPTQPPTYHRRHALLIALGAVVIVLILWNIRQLDFLLYPFRLFVTYVHEAGHGLTAIVTGGRFVNFEIFADGTGKAFTAGGWRFLILPAGYLGAAVFGAVLFYLVNRIRYTRSIAVILGIGLILFSLIFGRFSITALLVGIGFGAVLIGMGWKLSNDINILVLNILSMLTGLNGVLDLWMLVRNSNIGLGSTLNDAAAFQREIAPLVPAAVWAFLWAVIAILILGVSIWYSVVRPMRKSSHAHTTKP